MRRLARHNLRGRVQARQLAAWGQTPAKNGHRNGRDLRVSPYSPDALRDLERHPHPAWLWDAERRRIIWSNRAGLAFWREATVLDLIDRQFDAATPAVERILALARDLEGQEPVTETFVFQMPARGVGGSPKGTSPLPTAVTAQCRAMALEDGRAGVLMVAQAAKTSPDDQTTRASLFETIAGDLPVAIAVFDRHGSLLYRNAACRDLLDDGTGDGTNTSDLLTQWLGSQACAEDVVQQTLSLGSFSAALPMQSRFGERAQRVTTRRISAPAQGRLALLMCFQDIEDRRRYELGLVARLEKLETWLAGIVDFTFELDENLRLADPNPDLAKYLGLTGANLAGRYWAEIADEAGIDAAGEILAQLTAGTPVRSRVTLGTGPDSCDLVLSFSPLTHSEGLFVGFTGAGLALGPFSQPQSGKARPTSQPEAAPPAQAEPDAKTAIPAVEAKPAATPQNNAEPTNPEIDAEDAEAFSAIARALASRPGGSTAALLRDPQDTKEAKSAGQQAAGLRVVGGLESKSSKKEVATDAPIPVIEDAARLEKMTEPVLVHRNFDIVFANAAMRDMFGNGAGQTAIADDNLLNLFPDERARLFSLQSKFDDGVMPAHGELFDVKLRARAPDRSTVSVIASIAPVSFEGQASVRMIVESRGPVVKPADPALPTPPSPPPPSAKPEVKTEAETGGDDRELREAKARENELRAVINSAADGIATLDEQGNILTLNASAEAIFGVNALDVAGQPLSGLFEDQGGQTVDAYIQSLGQAGASQLYSEGCEVVGRRKDGGAPPLFVTIGRMKIDEGLRFCVVIRDITQWKAAQETLRQEKEEAEQASTRKSDFLAKVSHELRTPLNAIIGFSEVMSEEKFGPIANDRYKGYLADIHASGGHLLSLINDLLDLSKIESGNLELDFTSVDVAAIVAQAVSLLEPQAARERVIIRTSLPDTLPPVVADDRSIRQIVLNLVSNAIKFTPPGGQVILSVLVDETGQLQIRVRDTGVGMSAEELTDAMVPFTQISNGEHTDLAGTGLGLPLTRALTEANRAEFKIESTPSAGTLVQVIFPTNRVLAS